MVRDLDNLFEETLVYLTGQNRSWWSMEPTSEENCNAL